MGRGPIASTTAQLGHLRELTLSLGDAVTIDDVARATLSAAVALPGVLRAGLALTQGAGRELQFVSSHETADAATVRWSLIDAYDDLPLTHAVRDSADVDVPTLDDLESRFPDILERQRSIGTRSLVALALVRNEECLGGLMLSFDTEFAHHDDGDRDFLGAFAAQVTQAVRRGLAYQIQHTNSEQLQRSLMPHGLPDLDGLALGSYYQPGGLNVDVGGDWYDVIELPDGTVVVALGDVMGKGMEAAIVMGEVRSALRAYAILDPTPGVVLDRLDRLVTSFAVPEQIVTLLYGLIDARRTSMRLSVAGHPGPLLIPAVGMPTVLGNQLGPALGFGAGPWPETTFTVAADSTVLFFSDGLVKSRTVDIEGGIGLLREEVSAMGSRRRNPRELCARLSERVRREDADDDVTVLALAVTASRHERSATTRLPADVSAAGIARRFVIASLAAWDVDDDVAGVAELCVSELVTNAVIHSGTEPEVTVRIDDTTVLVLVHDQGNRGTVERMAEYDPMSVSGRGLTLVDALADTWSAEHNADGTTVWFELALTDREAV